VIDLHSHLLPNIDDGAKDLAQSLEMARIAVADGIGISVCTPHILPGVFNNKGPDIRAAVAKLQRELDKAEIPLILAAGADVHLAPNLLQGLKSGRVLPLGDSRYFLLEPPQDVLPPRFGEFLFDLLSAGYVPILTHPERSPWLESQYKLIVRLVRSGVWMQITAGSLVGTFGRAARHWAQQLLNDGLVHVMASDAHGVEARPPRMTEAVELVERRLGRKAARDLVVTRPAGVLRNVAPADLPVPARQEKVAGKIGKA
jgi:protein-tyrosine phosphatase